MRETDHPHAREIGVRLALGDTPAGVLRRIMSDGLRPTFTGLLVLVVALLVACLIPARRAARRSPLDALRAE